MIANHAGCFLDQERATEPELGQELRGAVIGGLKLPEQVRRGDGEAILIDSEKCHGRDWFPLPGSSGGMAYRPFPCRNR